MVKEGKIKNINMHAVNVKNIYMQATADITIECPNCGLEFTEYNNSNDDWHTVECPCCKKICNYKYGWWRR